MPPIALLSGVVVLRFGWLWNIWLECQFRAKEEGAWQ